MPPLSTDLQTVTEITDYNKNEVKNSRDDKGHYDQLTKMRERRIAMEADKIKVPTLIIWGRHDKSVSWKNGELYHGLFANSTFHIIEKGYHAPFRRNQSSLWNMYKRSSRRIHNDKILSINVLLSSYSETNKACLRKGMK